MDYYARLTNILPTWVKTGQEPRDIVTRPRLPGQRARGDDDDVSRA